MWVLGWLAPSNGNLEYRPPCGMCQLVENKSVVFDGHDVTRRLAGPVAVVAAHAASIGYRYISQFRPRRLQRVRSYVMAPTKRHAGQPIAKEVVVW